ncbi:MAG TPA: hypothetical protein EYP36_08620, partial [Calditrichaeota bacterium]|nr:hypothetical protein [Calditrichota bacterium]
MKRLLILGGGTAGTMMANKLAPILEENDWQITLVDEYETHYYPPGFLFIPFGIYNKNDVIKPKRDFYPSNIEVIMSQVDVIKPKENQVVLSNGKVLGYDMMIIATFGLNALLKKMVKKLRVSTVGNPALNMA